jgi:UDP-4-amino-4,6-dideoxy-N-acetyl-beta-L-altrosamine transaminase
VIPYGRQDINDEDVAAVTAALRSDFITQGPMIDVFESTVARYVGAPFGVAVCNATAGLHIAYLSLGLSAGDRLWTVPNTFVATANAARFCGAEVDFIDIASDTYVMDVEVLSARLAQARRHGRLPKIVAPVHFAGQSCDMRAIRGLADDYGFKIVEDASHAIGADYLGGKVGDCRYCDLAVFSFHPVKIVTTAEGGIVTTKDHALAKRLSELRSHGTTRDPSRMDGPSEGPWYYQQIDLGLNYRMTELQAALGVSQMKRVDAFVARRRALAARYDEALASLPLILPAQNPHGRSAFHLYPVQLHLETIGRTRREIFESLRAAGIGVNVHYIPVHLQPYYRRRGFKPGDFPESERYYERAISIPLFGAMTDAEQSEVVARLSETLLARAA